MSSIERTGAPRTVPLGAAPAAPAGRDCTREAAHDLGARSLPPSLLDKTYNSAPVDRGFTVVEVPPTSDASGDPSFTGGRS
jgi:hypothetical protein